MPRIIEGFDAGTNVLTIPFRLIVAGGSGSGKTELVKQLVDKQHFTKEITDILYCYPGYLEEIPTEFERTVHYHAGLPDTSLMSTLKNNSLIILDDMMIECAKDVDIAKLFTVVARKRNISVILIVQNIYVQGKIFRTIRLNSTHIILFRFRAANDVNLRMIRDLGLKHHVSKSILDKAICERYTYIMIDMHPDHQFEFGCARSNIFEKYFPVYYREMEYVAIPKADFVKYFKIIEAKKGKVKAIKNEIAIKKESGRTGEATDIGKSSKRERKRAREQSSDDTSETDSD